MRSKENPFRVAGMLAMAVAFGCLSGTAVSRSAEAQTLITAKPLVAVFDLENRTKYQGGLFARQVTDAIAEALRESNEFDIVKREQLEQSSNLTGIQPIDNESRRHLAKEVGADFYGFGRVLEVEIKQEAGAKYARVKVAFELADRFTAELANGAAVSAESSRRVGYSGADDMLVNEAVSRGARLIATQIRERQMPQATVLMASQRDEFLLNKGEADGVKPEMEFVVLRPRGNEFDRVGKLKVSQVSKTESYAKVLENPNGIRAEDIARAIYKMPGIAGDILPSQYQVKRQGTKMLGMLLAVAAVIVLGSSKGGGGTSGVTAQAANEFSGIAGVNTPAVYLSWKAPRGANTTTIMGYNLYRSDLGYGFGAEPCYFYPGGTVSNLNWVDDTVTGPAFTALQVQNNGQEDDPEELDGTGIAIAPGTQYQYSITAVSRVQNVSSGGGGTGGGGGGDITYTFFETDVASKTGNVTPLDTTRGGAGILVAPTNGSKGVNLNDVTFQWLTVAGGNTYVVQLARDVQFKTDVVFLDQRQSSEPPNTQISMRFQNDARLSKYDSSTEKPVFWRVGAKNAYDSPGPVGGWVFSNTYSFTPQITPPPPPVE